MADDNNATPAPDGAPEGENPAEPAAVILRVEDMPEARFGAPFAFSGGGADVNPSLIEQDDKVPASKAYIQCDCGQAMGIDLLDGNYKVCPGCGARFTHMLVVAGEDDADLAGHMVREIARRNDLLDDDDEDDDDEDDDDDDDEDDDEGTPPDAET